MSEVDVQAFLTGEPDAVAMLRAGLVHQLESSPSCGPDVVNHVLSRVAEVPHYGDDEAYITYAVAVSKAALEEVLLPRIAALEAHNAALEVQNTALEAHIEQSMREFELFRRMTTPKTIQ